jgi:acyl carrier protein
MLPAVVVIDALPLLPNGKVDLAALAALEGPSQAEPSEPQPSQAETEPLTTETEHRVAEVWREVLKVQQIGPEDDFFDLGGHSLTAMRVVARLREQFGSKVTVRLLFEARTIRRLAARIEENQ